MNVTLRLLRSELRLLLREPLVLAFVFAFPVITVLILGGVFDDDDPAFEGVLPSDYYIAAYFAVVIAAVGLIMLPVHIASYREAGVLRRFDAAGFPRWAFPVSQLVIGAVFVAIGAVLLLATAALAYGLPEVENVARTIAGIVAGSLAFISIGVLLGTVLPNARAAQGVGLLLFLPMFLLAGGGPPPEAMSSVMNDIATVLPLTHVVRAIQEPWLGLGTGTDHLLVVIAIFVVATLATLTRSGSFGAGRDRRPAGGRRVRDYRALRRADAVSAMARKRWFPNGVVIDNVITSTSSTLHAPATRVHFVPSSSPTEPRSTRIALAWSRLRTRCRRRVPGRDAARLARTVRVARWQAASAVAVHDRDQRVPRRDQCAAEARAPHRSVDLGGAVTRTCRHLATRAVTRLPKHGTSNASRWSWPSSRPLQHLRGRQRAVLILREVLGFSAREVAQLLRDNRAVGQQRPPAGPEERP